MIHRTRRCGAPPVGFITGSLRVRHLVDLRCGKPAVVTGPYLPPAFGLHAQANAPRLPGLTERMLPVPNWLPRITQGRTVGRPTLPCLYAPTLQLFSLRTGTLRNALRGYMPSARFHALLALYLERAYLDPGSPAPPVVPLPFLPIRL